MYMMLNKKFTILWIFLLFLLILHILPRKIIKNSARGIVCRGPNCKVY